MKNQDFINYVKDNINTGMGESIHYLKYGLKLDSEGDDTIKFTEKQRESIKQLVKDLNNTKKEIMKKLNDL